MREILFRGKRFDNGEWVEGHYHYANWHLPPSMKIVDTTHYILPIGHGDSYNVAPETVGQFTGLLDKNGNRIFEGDIMNNAGNVVGFCNGCFCINGDSDLSLWTVTEVIGNIHDDPELR